MDAHDKYHDKLTHQHWYNGVTSLSETAIGDDGGDSKEVDNKEETGAEMVAKSSISFFLTLS